MKDNSEQQAGGIDAVLEKIKKVMRLAEKAGTEGERVAAENAAQRLADLHGIDLSKVKVAGTSEAKVVQADGDKRYHRSGVEVGFICHILRKHFGVVVMQNYRSGSSWMYLTFFGVNINIEIAKYVYDILQRESRRSWLAVRGWGYNRRSFMTGWFQQIDRKLTEHPLRNDRVQFMEERDAAERKFKQFREQHSEVKDKYTKASREDKQALYSGYEAASKVNLARPCEGRATASPFALGHTKQLKGGL